MACNACNAAGPDGKVAAPTGEAALEMNARTNAGGNAPSELARLRRQLAHLESAPHFETAKARAARHSELRDVAAELKKALHAQRSKAPRRTPPA